MQRASQATEDFLMAAGSKSCTHSILDTRVVLDSMLIAGGLPLKTGLGPQKGGFGCPS